MPSEKKYINRTDDIVNERYTITQEYTTQLNEDRIGQNHSLDPPLLSTYAVLCCCSVS